MAQEIVPTDPRDREWLPVVSLVHLQIAMQHLPDTLFVVREPPRKCAKDPKEERTGGGNRRSAFDQATSSSSSSSSSSSKWPERSHQLPHYVRFCLSCSSHKYKLIIRLRLQNSCWFAGHSESFDALVMSAYRGLLVPIPRRGTCHFSRSIKLRRKLPSPQERGCHDKRDEPEEAMQLALQKLMGLAATFCSE